MIKYSLQPNKKGKFITLRPLIYIHMILVRSSGGTDQYLKYIKGSVAEEREYKTLLFLVNFDMYRNKRDISKRKMYRNEGRISE